MRIHGPLTTLSELEKGASIARFGDGECRVMEEDYRAVYFQRPDTALAAELRSIISDQHSAALVGLFHGHADGIEVRVRSQTPGTVDRLLLKWSLRLQQFAHPGRDYYSTYISRPDAIPSYGATPAYFDRIAGLWRGKRVTLVANGARSLTPQLLIDEGAEGVDWVDCPATNAYDEIDALVARALAKPNHTILLCAGMTATCMAERLAKAGRQAIDIGHVGIFWRKYDLIPEWHMRYRENSADRNGNLIGNEAYANS